MKKIVCLVFWVMASLFISALAEKQSIGMGTTMRTLPVLVDNYNDVEYYFDFKDVKKQYGVRFKPYPGVESEYYVIEFTNHNMNEAEGIFIGHKSLRAKVYEYDTTQEDNTGLLICGDEIDPLYKGLAKSNSFSFKPSGTKEYFLRFDAFGVEPGMVSFKIHIEKDPEGDVDFNSFPINPGKYEQHSLAIAEDIDFYSIKPFDRNTDVTVVIENRISNPLKVLVFSEYKEKLTEVKINYDENYTLSFTAEAGLEYYIQILNDSKSGKGGRYFIGYCDGVNHIIKEEKVLKEASCLETGERGAHCEACDKKIITSVIPALGHKFTTESIIKEATCMEPGE